MTYTVYCLYSIQYNKIYIDYTSDLIDSFYSHNSPTTKGHTIRYRPWVVAYTKIFEEKQMAMKRDKELKFSRSRAFLKD